MKRFTLLLAGFGLAGAVFAGELPFDPQIEFFRVRAMAYTDVALLQMQTDRWELEALARGALSDPSRYAPVYALVKRGEELILRMRSALPTEFEWVRALFEQNRAEIDRALGRDRWGG